MKLDYPSSHTFALDAAIMGGNLLNISAGQADLTPVLNRLSCQITNLGQVPVPRAFTPAVEDDFDGPVDDAAPWAAGDGWEASPKRAWISSPGISRARSSRWMSPVSTRFFCSTPSSTSMSPSGSWRRCASPPGATGRRWSSTAANVGFVVTRLMLLFGQLNYGRRGVLDRTHRRLFTFGSLGKLLEQSGYRIIETRGVPAPFPLAVKSGWLNRWLLRCNQALIRLSRGLFSYQIFIRAQALPSVHHLLEQTVESSDVLRGQHVMHA